MRPVTFINARVFDGTSPHLLESQTVRVVDGLIEAIAAGAAPGPDDDVVDCAGRCLMPGLIDLHVHIWFADMNVSKLAQLPTEYLAMFATTALRGSLDRGFTSLRDAGGTDGGYAWAIAQGVVVAPRYFHTGRVISQTGGHGDFRAIYERDLDGCMCCPPLLARFTAIADGADSVRRAVREEYRRGSRAIKMMCSGGVASPTDPMDKLQYTDAEILAAVEEARMRDSYVFAHCHPDLAIRRAAELGIRCIEHATFITVETADILARLGTYVVPTLAVAKALNEDGPKFGLPKLSQEKLDGCYEAMIRGLGIMKRAGVKMGYGTDLLAQHQVRQCTEFSIRAEVLPAYDILISATSIAADIVQETGRLGVIRAGAYADIIVVDGDPLADIEVLAQSGATLPVIMKAGEFHKRLI